jgi:hypothetical protein
MDHARLEKYSSAFTLSDMEVFIFPELLYALVLANIMSPRLWAWKADPWFAGLDKMSPHRRVQRLKQYIMDHYSFNLDLDTWGLTTKPRELARFEGIASAATLAQSNALFGYEGDKYYFDMDIRRHFGLDKYEGDVIPYWKTETVEAMDAFRHKPQHHQGAGECVSLSTLYAAALYVVLGVPLEDIFILATPLHSQNYVLQGEGFITNNRRLVTKSMWFNGTTLSEKARRALEHERVTIVSHLSGHVHIDYPEATIDPGQYRRFAAHLQGFLSTRVNYEIFANFLRTHGEYRKYFQIEYLHEGHRYYLTLDRLYHYEHASKNRVGDATQDKLLEEVDLDEFALQPFPGLQVLNTLEKTLNGLNLGCCSEDAREKFKVLLAHLPDVDECCARLQAFVCTRPVLPGEDKQHLALPALALPVGWSREQIREYLDAHRSEHPVADLAFFAGRRFGADGWPAFLKACLERNPVSVVYFTWKNVPEIYQELLAWPQESIYDEGGLATPDEVVNFSRGDGVEKALTLANVLRARTPELPLALGASGESATLRAGEEIFTFANPRGFDLQLDLP